MKHLMQQVYLPTKEKWWMSASWRMEAPRQRNTREENKHIIRNRNSPGEMEGKATQALPKRYYNICRCVQLKLVVAME